MFSVLQDLRSGLRIFTHRPGFAAACVLTLAVGMGATLTIFSFVDAILLRPLPYTDSDQLVLLDRRNVNRPDQPATTVSAGDFFDWQEQNTSFQSMAAFSQTSVSLTGKGEPQRLRALQSSSDLFETMGAVPAAGRTLSGQEDNPQRVVISDRLRQQLFQSDRSVVGQTITLDGRPWVVSGVAPPGFSFPRELPFVDVGLWDPRQVDVWMPAALRPGDRRLYYLHVVARLKPDVTLARAQQEMAAVAERLRQNGDPDNRALMIGVSPFQKQVTGPIASLLLLLGGAGAFVLLIACANLANLLLARNEDRQREVAIRSALGSSRGRLLRLLIAESVVLSVAGGLVGLFIALWGVQLAGNAIPSTSLPGFADVTVDGRLFLFAVAVSIAIGCSFGAVPAYLATRTPPALTLKTYAPSVASSSKLLKTLVVAEVAVTFVLVAGAGLLLKSFNRLTSVDPGFQPDRVLTIGVRLPEAGYETVTQMAEYADNVLDRLRRVPGVQHAGVVNWLPFGSGYLAGDLDVEAPAEWPRGLAATKSAISPDYFKAMSMPIVDGRAFEPREAEGVAVVTDDLAKQVWPGQSAVGKRVTLGFGSQEKRRWVTIVGVVGNVRYRLDDQTHPTIYMPLAQTPQPFLIREGLTFAIRTTADAAPAGVLVHQMKDVDSNLPIDRVATMRELLALSVADPRFRSVILGTFALAATALASIGIFGVLAFTVARRTREIGIRMALGAERSRVLTMVVRQALTMTAGGLLLGLVGALALTRLLAAYLFEVTPRDPMMLAIAGVVLVAIAVVAAFVPARRAADVDPLTSLRAE